jgi:hypothetical protein
MTPYSRQENTVSTMCEADRAEQGSPVSSDDEYSGEKPKHYSKRLRFFGRPVFRSKMAMSSEFMESKKFLHMAFMIGCLYILLNAMTVADLSFGSRPRVLNQLKEVETQQLLQDADAQQKQASKKRGNMLRSISSIYNKNEQNILNVIPKEDWENHAYLPMPKLEPIDDEPQMLPEAEEKPKEDKEGETTKGEATDNKLKEDADQKSKAE